MSTVRMSFDVPKDLHEAIKSYSMLESETMKDYIIEAIVARIYKDRKPNKMTIKTLQDSDKGIGLIHFDSLEEMRKKLGI